jgi:hypothetical protein
MKTVLSLILFSLLFLSCDDEHQESVKAPVLTSSNTTSGDWSMQVNYAYRDDGKIADITWERRTPFLTQGKDLYYYDNEGRLTEQVISITNLVDETIKFNWLDDKVVAASSYVGGEKLSYTFYEYEGDQLSKSEFFRRLPEGGGFARISEDFYSYRDDGNLHQIKNYLFNPEEAKMFLSSTETFEGYLPSPAPLQSVEILPTIKLQKNLHTLLTIETGVESHQYKISYTLRKDRYPLERIVDHKGSLEKTTFVYTTK